MGTKPDRTPRAVAVLCFTVGGAAVAGAVATAFAGNLGGTVGLLVFGLVWAGFGLLTARIGAAFAPRTHAPEPEPGAAAQPAEPTEPAPQPWLARSDWAAGRVEEDGRERSRAWLVTGICQAALGLAGLAAALRGADGVFGLVGLLLLAVGAAIAIRWARARRRGRAFGVSVIDCRTMPARPGGRFRGTARTGVPLQGAHARPFTVRLACHRRSTARRHGGGEEVEVRTLWRHEETVMGGLSSAGPTFQVPLDLAIPDGLPATETGAGGERTYWTLALRTECAGVDYAAEFEIPVFAERA